MRLRKLKTATNRFKTLRAIYPNAGVEAWYQSRLQHIVNSIELSVHEILDAYKEAAPTGYAGDAVKSPSLFIRRALSKWGERWTTKLDAMSERLAEQFAERSFRATQTSMKNAFREAGFTVQFSATKASVEAFRAVVGENVGLIRSIHQQYLKDVEGKVWRSAMKGGDLHDLSKDLKKSYGVSTKRAALIARDQNAKAKATLEAARDLELGITHAIWQHSSAGKVPRPTHVANDGKRYSIKTGWFDPDANGPGKGAHILPGELINCRCTGRAIIPAFDD
jgi:uncharacterized protein with gpF-like domain